MRQAVVLVIVTTLCTDASARRLPKNVQLLERPGGTGGKASFDGKWYAYWAFTNKRLRRIGLKLYSIPGRKVVLTVPCSKDRSKKAPAFCDGPGSGFYWSRKSPTVVFSTAEGLHELDARTRSLRRIDPYPFWSYNFGKGDHLYRFRWFRAGKEHRRKVYRDRQLMGILPPPPRFSAAKTRYKNLYDMPWAGDRAHECFLGCRVNPYSDATEALWVTFVETRTVKELPRPRGKSCANAVLSPAHEWVCYLAPPALACVNLTTGEQRAIKAGKGYRVTDHVILEGQHPFSPSGGLVGFIGRKKSTRAVFIHDFGAKTTRMLVPSMDPYSSWQFASDEHIILLDHGGRGAASLMRYDVASGRAQPLIYDNQYATVDPVPGNPRVFFVGRERQGTRDLVRVDVPPPRR